MSAIDDISGNLAAWKLPNSCAGGLSETTTSVNQMRVLIGCLKDAKLKFKEDRIFVYNYARNIYSGREVRPDSIEEKFRYNAP